MRSLWWSVVLVTLQCWAGFELIRMSAQSRVIATVFGVAGAALTLYVSWPLIDLVRHSRELLNGGPGGVMMIGPTAISLVIPIATLVLVNRKIAPTARARYRAKAPEQPPAEPPPAMT
jgi:hypothetical protein